jgi:hypothetical protein
MLYNDLKNDRPTDRSTKMVQCPCHWNGSMNKSATEVLVPVF